MYLSKYSYFIDNSFPRCLECLLLRKCLKYQCIASESGTALAKGLGQMSLVNNYQTFRPNLGSSSVVVRLQGKVTYISVGGGAGEMTVGGKIMGGKLGVWEVT